MNNSKTKRIKEKIRKKYTANDLNKLMSIGKPLYEKISVVNYLMESRQDRIF